MAITYTNFIEKTKSEKIWLAFVNGNKRLFNTTNYATNVEYKEVDQVVDSVKYSGTVMTLGSDKDSLTAGQYYFDISEMKLYLYWDKTSNPNDIIIVTYKFYLSNAPINLSYNLSDDGQQVYYSPRILNISSFSSEINSELTGIALIGNGSLKLENNDGYFKSLFDSYVWENQKVEIYSYNRQLAPSSAQIRYRGIIKSKIFLKSNITFSLKDDFDFLKAKISSTRFDSSDQVISSNIDIYKRRIFGRVDGLRLLGIDQYDENNYQITGTVSTSAASPNVSGSGTSFLSELTIGDVILIDGTIELTINSITNDTALVATDNAGSTVSGKTCKVKTFVRSSPKINRVWSVSEKALKEESVTTTNFYSLNELPVTDGTNFLPDDWILVNSEYRQISNVSKNLLTFTQALGSAVSVGSTLTKPPVQEVYYKNKRISQDYYTITNSSSGCYITFDEDMESNLFDELTLTTGSIGAGSRTITTTASYVDIVRPNDWIRVASDDKRQVIQVTETTIVLRTAPVGAHSGTIFHTKIVPINNDSVIVANVVGETLENTTSGTWIRKASQFVRLMLQESGLDDYINATSFDNADLKSTGLISLVAPFNYGSKNIESYKTLINNINETTQSNLALDSDLKLIYNTFDTSVDFDNIDELKDEDIISYAVSGTTPDLYRYVNGAYRIQDANKETEENDSLFYEFENDFVANYVGINTTKDLNFYYYYLKDARSAVQRYSILRSLNSIEFLLQGNINLAKYSIGDIIILDFNTLFDYQGISNGKGIYEIIGVNIKTTTVDLKVSNIGNIFNRRAVISDHSSDYDNSTDQQKLLYSFITNDLGLMSDTAENTDRKNIII